MPDAAALKSSMHFMHAPSLVFAASDFLEWPSPLSEALLRLRRMRHDVRLLALRTQAEVDASFSTGTSYVDREQAGAPLYRLDAAGRAAYRAALSAHFASVGAACRQYDTPFYETCIEQPLVGALRGWLRLASARIR
jgi:hypothetical protein